MYNITHPFSRGIPNSFSSGLSLFLFLESKFITKKMKLMNIQ